MNPTRSFPIAIAIAALTVSSACGSTSTSTTSAADTGVDGPSAIEAHPTEAIAPAQTIPPISPPISPPDSTVAPAPTTTAAPVETIAPAPSTTVADADTPAPTTTAPDPTPEPEPDRTLGLACGTFGAIPPRPDSMPTRLFDTDGDGVLDDEATAFGGEGGWRVRIVENGVTSEAVMPDIEGWAHLDLPVRAPNGEWITVVDAETDEQYTFTTDANGCVTLITGATGDEIDALRLEE